MAFLINLCRYLLAGVFIFSGLVKANEIIGTQYKIQEYLVVFGWSDAIRSDIPLYVSVMLCVTEFMLGLYLFMGVCRKVISNATCLVLAFFTTITFWLAVDNSLSDCGCFGEVITLSNWQTFVKNVVLLMLAVFVSIGQKHVKPLVQLRVVRLLTIWSLLGVVALITYGSRHLPLVDTSDFHVCADLHDIDLPMHNFYLYSTEADTDLTDSIVNVGNYTFLMVSPQLSLACDDDIDLINELYDYCKSHDYGFYAVTASADSDIETWKIQTGADYPFLGSDDNMLRTLVRANPGLVILKNGVIEEKFGVADWPDISVYPSTAELKAEMIHNDRISWIQALGGFLLPLVVLSLFGWWNNLKTNKNNPKKEKK